MAETVLMSEMNMVQKQFQVKFKICSFTLKWLVLFPKCVCVRMCVCVREKKTETDMDEKKDRDRLIKHLVISI